MTPPVTKMLSDTSGKNPAALAAQIGKSQLMAHSKPPPTAQPLIAPTTGLDPSTIASVTCWIALDQVAGLGLARLGWVCSLRSSPAQKARPAPVKMMTRVAGSSLASANACVHVVDELTVHGVEAFGAVERQRSDTMRVELAQHGLILEVASHGDEARRLLECPQPDPT